MKKIFKYAVLVTDGFSVEMPDGARILTVDTQNGQPYMWALVDPDNPVRKRTFHVYGTGNPLPVSVINCTYIGSFQMYEGLFIGHLFVE